MSFFVGFSGGGEGTNTTHTDSERTRFTLQQILKLGNDVQHSLTRKAIVSYFTFLAAFRSRSGCNAMGAKADITFALFQSFWI